MRDGGIGVGIIGTGFGRSAILPAFRAVEGVDVVALCGRQQARTEALARKFDIPHAFSDYREMMRLGDLDLVAIASPPALHHAMTLAALDAGKHIICEKPMAMNLTEAREMLERARAAGVVHVIDHELRFNPTRVRVKQMLDEGYIGRVYHATIHTVTDYRADPVRRPWDWWSDAAMGGGSLGATASHQIDLVRWWLGEIARVAGQLSTFVQHRKLPDSDEFRAVTSDDQCAFLCEFESGAIGSVFITSVAQHAGGSRVEIHGDAGSLILDAGERLWGRRAGEQELTELTVPDPNATLPGIEKNIWAVSFVALAREVTNAIRTNRQPERGATFYDGVRCQAVMDAIRHSWSERRWVDVPR